MRISGQLSGPMVFCSYQTSIKSILIINPTNYSALFHSRTFFFFSYFNFFHWLRRPHFLYLFLTRLHSTDYFTDIFCCFSMIVFSLLNLYLCLSCLALLSGCFLVFESIDQIKLQLIKIELEISGNGSNEICVRISRLWRGSETGGIIDVDIARMRN